MLKLLVLGGLVFASVMLFRGKNPVTAKRKEDTAVDTKQDPICNAFVDTTTDFKVKYYDTIYYFCSQKCMDEFIQQKQEEA